MKYISVVLVSIAIVFSMGCISDDENKDKDDSAHRKVYSMTVAIVNLDNITYHVAFEIIDENNNSIYNSTAQLEPDEYIYIKDITKTIGKYEIKILLNGKYKSEHSISVGQGILRAEISIKDNSTEVSQLII